MFVIYLHKAGTEGINLSDDQIILVQQTFPKPVEVQPDGQAVSPSGSGQGQPYSNIDVFYA
jgi:hypothetical protein